MDNTSAPKNISKTAIYLIIFLLVLVLTNKLTHEIIEKIRTNSEMITLQEFCDKWKLICGSGFQLGSQKVDASLFKGKYLFDSKERQHALYRLYLNSTFRKFFAGVFIISFIIFVLIKFKVSKIY